MKESEMKEEKWIKTDPAKKGMFKGKSKAEIDAEKAKLKKKHANQEGPISAADKTKMHELEFASRAKSKGGLEEELSLVPKEDEPRRVRDQRTGHTTIDPFDKKKTDLRTKGIVAPGHEKTDKPRFPHQRFDLEPQSKEQDPFASNRAARQKGIVMKENLVKKLRRLLETEVSQAEVMMAAKGFAQELQEMIEKIGRLQNEDLPPVTDQMRETYGMESSSAFQTQIYGALQGVMDALYTAKGQVDDSVSNLASTGQVSAQTDMDKDIGMDDMGGSDDMGGDADLDMDEPDLDLDNIGDEPEMGDEFGGEEPLGREKKMESLERKVFEMKKLVAKVKKLKESSK